MGSFSGPKDWGRLLTAMLTPFASDGSVDLKGVRQVARHLVGRMGNDGIVVSGTTAESPTLSHEEKLAILDATLEEVGDEAAVVFGAGTYNTQESIEYARAAEKAGAHGIMAVNPYYNKPGQEGLFAHFSAIAQATSLPVMLYNIQPRSSINLETPTLVRLATEVPNICAVKEASGNVGQIGEVCASVPTGFRVYSGDDALTLPVMSLGGHGLVSVAAHIVGDRMKRMIEAFPTDPAQAAAIARELNPVIRAVFSAPSPVPVKYALARQGIGSPSVRLPLVELSPEQQRHVDAVLASRAAIEV
ncbi:MAG: 4-hydroxy-tetrahydrodipicolinate synthase [Fimbriimonadaceae bacterium]